MTYIKLLEENGRKLQDIGFVKDFLPNAKARNVKLGKLDYIRIKSFYATNNTFKKMKRSLTEENICKSYLTCIQNT